MAETARARTDYDVVIVGGGPAGLSAAIRLKQLDPDLSVVLLEKGSEIGAHILSGAVLDPVGLDALLPDWRTGNAPVDIAVHTDDFHLLGPAGAVRLPRWFMPPLMHNRGHYVVSMGNVCRWLGGIAETLGVEIYAGMACSELVTSANGAVCGVVAGEFGRNGDGAPGTAFEPGMALCGKYVLLAEGAHGSLSKQVIANYALGADAQPQKYGLGMKELWEIAPERHRPGKVAHFAGWPLAGRAGGGGFVYHQENNQISIGLVVHLDYANPYLSPYREFQRFKHHPLIAPLLRGGRRVAYGARAISAGGYQSMPDPVFPGGALLGCAVGLVNLPRIKGNHNAMLSGKAAAEHVHTALQKGCAGDILAGYARELRHGPIGCELSRVRNVKPLWSRYGAFAAFALGGLDMWTNGWGFSLLGTLRHRLSDWAATAPAARFAPIAYPKPDGVVSFDRLTNVSFSMTNHADGQPVHLKLADPALPLAVNLPVYAEPAQRYCPAGVYEIVDGKFTINYQNCVHCKSCDIKDPSQNINWTTPQGGDGPNYPNM